MRIGLLVMTLAALVAAGASAVSVAQEEGGNPEAAMLENPITMTAESIEAGEKLYMRRCRGCHGSDALGGPPKEGGGRPTPNLVDHEYLFGSTDGEIFWVIRNGIPPELVMEPFDDRLDETNTWNVVNYIRSLQEAHHDE